MGDGRSLDWIGVEVVPQEGCGNRARMTKLLKVAAPRPKFFFRTEDPGGEVPALAPSVQR
jgi:hypothetical protein